MSDILVIALTMFCASKGGIGSNIVLQNMNIRWSTIPDKMFYLLEFGKGP